MQSASQVNMQEIQTSVGSAQTALANAQTALSTIFTSSGSFNWDIFLGGVNFTTLGTNTVTCLQNAFPQNNIAMLVLTSPSDIATALKCVLDDVVQVAGIANTDLNSAMSTLNSAMALATPGSADAQAIQAMITEVQTLQTEYNSTMTALASQLTIVTTFLNELPTMATGLIPIPIASLLVGMGIDMFVQPIVTEIINFQSELEAL